MMNIRSRPPGSSCLILFDVNLAVRWDCSINAVQRRQQAKNCPRLFIISRRAAQSLCDVEVLEVESAQAREAAQ